MGISLAAPFSASVDPLFRYVWTGGEPNGDYTIFLVAVRAGGFADNRIDSGDILALRTGGLHVRPRPQFTPENGGTVTAEVSPDAGGTVTVTNASGTTFTLTLPPGAVPEPTTISATPIGGATGLPLDRLVGAVRFGPDGLQLNEPGTLSVALPASVRPLGTVGFTAKDDGTGFDTVPAAIVDGVATMRIGHFSTPGFGQSVCGPTVTTAVGRDACREMAERLAEAAQIIEEGPGGTPRQVRVQLSAELVAELRNWLTVGIQPLVSVDTGNGIATGHYFFMVGLRELDAVKAILELVTALDIGPILLPEVSAAEQLVPTSIQFLRDQENAQCLAEKTTYRDWLRRLFDLAGESRERGLPVSADTHGITCVVLTLTNTLPPTIPPEGATFTGIARVLFGDGAPLPDGPVVTIEAVERGLARIDNPTFAQGPNQATLTTTVAPPIGATGLQFDVRTHVPEIGLRRFVSVRHGHSVTVSGRSNSFSASVRAGSVSDSVSLSNTLSSLDAGADAVEEGGVAGAHAVGRARIDVLGQNAEWRLHGETTLNAEGRSSRPNRPAISASGTLLLRSSVTAELVGTFACRVVLNTTSREDDGGSAPFVVRLRRGSAVIFESGTNGTFNGTCDEGPYVAEVESRGSVTTPDSTTPDADRTYEFTITLTPRVDTSRLR